MDHGQHGTQPINKPAADQIPLETWWRAALFYEVLAQCTNARFCNTAPG
jgi:hypothetical protein